MSTDHFFAHFSQNLHRSLVNYGVRKLPAGQGYALRTAACADSIMDGAGGICRECRFTFEVFLS